MITIRKFFILIAIILSIVFIYGCNRSISEQTASASDTNELYSSEILSTDFYSGEETSSDTGITEKIKSGILYDVTADKIIWSENIYKKVYPASITKLLTAYTALEYVPADTVFSVGSELNMLKPQSSICFIEKGFKLTLYDLICGMLIASGNDAAYTAAVNTARFISDEELSDADALKAFCSLMNKTAEEIGMSDSHFCNPEGWDNENHYTTVNDLLKLSLCAFNNNVIREISGIAEKRAFLVSGETLIWRNTNELLNSSSEYYCPYVTGGKTGTTDNAGKCLIAAAAKCDNDYIAIVMKCDTDTQKYNSVIQLLNIIPDNQD